ncbi:hypothetical protein X802_06540 [Thermococcus guaymasensis DSM 11113]|uniref:DUF2341 domain-containing protein n=1 Tax=Thermococcus guaymasensis DSM 11113 TaxID=1432656 RepID=A0A0X1KKS8_9EURY|nr:DUF2341 domain-containing protein [Thermococcus guaymasensis]AJC71856.1 hypothetical protein X802_06540 [Thermococcus guaymasensis DSM 11113]
MRRKGFLLNSAVIVLLVPLLLLLATYEDVSHSIIIAQSERAQVERTYDVITFLNIEFQKALELSGKRAVVTAVDYVAVTGNFISPSYGANNTIRDFIKSGTSPTTTGYDTLRVMGKQTMRNWLSNVSKLLRDQGYIVSPSVDEIVDSMDITVALLDAFTVVIKARIPRVKITDASGTIVYEGPIPSNGDYVYSTVDIRDLEDPFFSAITGGRYHRSIRACKFAFPTLGIRPITFANASGSGGKDHYVGCFGGSCEKKFNYNETHIWQDNEFSITSFTIAGIPVKTDSIINEEGDLGVVVFENVSEESNWCEQSMENRVRMTLPSDTANSYVLLKLNPGTTPFANAYHSGNQASIRIYEDGTCNSVNYWIEEWNVNDIIIWLKVGDKTNFDVYYSTDPSYASEGNIGMFPYHKTDYSLSAGIKRTEQLFSDVPYSSFAIRFKMKADNGQDFDAGVGLTWTQPANVLSITVNYPRDVTDVQIPIYLNSTYAGMINHDSLNRAEIEVYSDRDLTQRVPFWIEYWNDNGALIWVRGNLPGTFYIKFNTGALTRGNGNDVFPFFDDFNESISQLKERWMVDPYNQGASISLNSNGIGTVTIDGGDSLFVMVNKNPLDITYDFAVRFRMKPNFQKKRDWDAGIGLWDGKWEYYDFDSTWDYYLIQQLFTDDIKYKSSPLAIHWAEWKTKKWNPTSISDFKLHDFWAEEDSDSDITTNRDYKFHTYEVTELLYSDETYFTDLTRGETNTYDSYYTTLDSLKYIYLVIDSEDEGRGATYDWIFVRKYIDLPQLQTSVSQLQETVNLQMIDDNPGHQDHGGDKLAILRNWNENLHNYQGGTWFLTDPQRYEVLVQRSGGNINIKFTDLTQLQQPYSEAVVEYSGQSLNIEAVIDNNLGNNAYFDWVFVVPYPYKVVTQPSFSQPEQQGSSSSGSASRVYDIDSFIDCLTGMTYFATENGWSFFERLEGSNTNHRKYEALANSTQDKLGISYEGKHYPIGLVSFMIPDNTYDPKLVSLLNSFGIGSDQIENNKISNADYYFMNYYLGKTVAQNTYGDKKGYPVLGISTDTEHTKIQLDGVFYIDPETAEQIFTTQGACDLLYGYNCP